MGVVSGYVIFTGVRGICFVYNYESLSSCSDCSVISSVDKGWIVSLLSFRVETSLLLPRVDSGSAYDCSDYLLGCGV